MKKSVTAKIATGWAVSALLMSVGGCRANHHPAASSTPPPSNTTVAPAPMSGNNPCADAEFTPEQFTGGWTESGDTTVVTLGADGTVRSRGDDGIRSGTWSYTPWEFTPGRDRMPAGEADRCVLWLRWTGPAANSDLVYVPLEVTRDSLKLSYVGRGDTLIWVRRDGDA